MLNIHIHDFLIRNRVKILDISQITDILSGNKSTTEIQNNMYGLATCICASHIQGFILLNQRFRPF